MRKPHNSSHICVDNPAILQYNFAYMTNKNINSACAFTGHKAEKLPWTDENSKESEDFKMLLYDEISHKIKAGCDTFYCGMCNGSDIICGEIVIKLKQTYPNIKLIAVIPFEDLPKNWSESWRDRYFSLAQKAHKEIMLNTKYQQGCFKERNLYLVKNANHLIAIQNNGDIQSGTSQIIHMAKMRNCDIVIIEPKSLNVVRIQPKPLRPNNNIIKL